MMCDDEIIELTDPFYVPHMDSESFLTEPLLHTYAHYMAMGYDPVAGFFQPCGPEYMSYSFPPSLFTSDTQPANIDTNSKKSMPARSPSPHSPSRGYSGRRTRSPYSPRSTRSRKSTYTEDRYYSDSFHSDDDDYYRRRKSRSPSIRTYNKPITKASPVVKRGGPARRGGAGSKRSIANTPRPQNDFVSKRVLSARRLKINELKNEIETVTQELDGIKRENKTLRRDNILQTRQLERFQDTEGELPQLIDRHNKEIRVLKEQIKKYKEKNDRANNTLRDVENELSKSQRKLKKLQSISDDNRLEERDSLNRRLGKAEMELEEKNNRVQQLERHLENLERNHRRELVMEMKKNAETKADLETLQEEFEYVKNSLREKEKELEIKNIYHNRIIQAQQRGRGSVSSLPALEPKYTPVSQTPEPTPREKAKQFEMKRKEEQYKKSELSRLNKRSTVNLSPQQILPSIPSTASNDEEKQKLHRGKIEEERSLVEAKKSIDTTATKKPPMQKEPIKQPLVKKDVPKRPKSPDPVLEREDSWAAIMRAQEKINNTQNTHASKDSLDLNDSLTSSRLDHSSREQTFTVLALEPSKSAPRELAQTAKNTFFATEIPERQNISAKRQQEERRRQEEQAQHEEEARLEEQERKAERARREERERREREREEQAMLEKREKMEKERKARDERERFEREERRRTQEEADRREKESQRQREQEEIASRQREQLSQNKEDPKETAERARVAKENERRRLENDTRAAEERRKKDLLLQKMKELDSGSTAPVLGQRSNQPTAGGGDFFSADRTSSQSSRKDYNFRATDENLFRGLPAQKEQKPARPRGIFDDDKPKKDNPLFGDKKGPSIFDDNDDLDLGGYQPSSYGNKPTKKPTLDHINDNSRKPQENNNFTKRGSLLGELFGDQNTKKSTTFGDDDIFASTTKAKPVISDKSSYPWEGELKTRGAGDKMLPLRPKADTSTIHNKPTVRAIDDVEDDLEELTL